jgi:CRP-like cAMP-binding protein
VSSAAVERNQILARIPESARARLLAAGEHLSLDLGTGLHRFGAPTTHYVFPLSGMVSLTVPTAEGANVEVALVGRHGLVGISHLLGHTAADLEAIVQISGEMVAIPSDLTPEDRALLRTAADGYAGTLLVELAQTAACNRLHSVEERTARWLLHAADRAETDDLKLTHDFMAMMLGVRRASVTVVVGAFAAAGLLRAERGRISIVDRDSLLKSACACYEVIRRAYATQDG